MFTPNLVIGLTIMAVGTVLLLDTLGIREAGSFMKYWPGLIVIFGASLVAQAFRPVDPAAPRRHAGGVPCFFLFLLGVGMFWTFGFPHSETQAAGRRIAATGVMRKAEATNVSGDVRSGRVAAVMGRSTLDLRQVALGPGEEVVVDVFVAMGRATVRVPDHWVVDTSALPVMGSVGEDRFAPVTADINADADAPASERTEASAASPATTGPPPRLRLRGFVMMGKVEVTS